MRRKPKAAAIALVVAASVMVSGSAASAEAADAVTSLGVPLNDVLLIGGTAAPGPDGEQVLWSVSSGEPAHLNAVDPATGEAVAREELPGAGGSWAVDHGPDGSVYVGSYGSAHLYRWTAETGVVDLGLPIDGETFIWDVSVAADGTVYGGTSPGGKVFGYDPDTGEFRDYGQLVEGQSYVRTVAAHGGKVYAGTDPPGEIVELKPKTGRKRSLPAPPDLDVSNSWIYDLDAVGDHLYARFGSASPNPLHVYDLDREKWTDRIDRAHGLEVSPADDTGGVHLIADGELVRYDPDTGETDGTDVPITGRVANTRGIGWAELGLPDYPGKSIVGMLWRGLMFRYNPQTGAHSFVQTTIEGEPIDISAIADGPDGRVYTGGFLNGGFAAIDPETGTRDEFHTFSQSEAMVRHGDRLYLGAYPDARAYEYDPAKPWNSVEYSPSPEPVPDENPVRLFDFKAEHQIRPRALASAGEYLAVGTMPDLDHLGGVFAVWDPRSGELVSSQRHVVTDQSIVTLAYRDGIVYGGTSIYGGQSATPPTQTEAKLFAWSVAEKRKLWEITPAPGKPTLSGLSFDGQGRLWGIAGGEVFAVDVASQEVTAHLEYGDSDSGLGRIAYNPVDDGLYGVLAGSEVFRLDPRTHDKHVIHDGAAAQLDVHPGGDVYFSSGAELFRYDLPGG